MSIQPYQPPTEVITYSPQDQAVRRLTEWAQSAQAAHQMATTLVQTSFVPDSFRNKPGEATAAILAGLEVGLQPMAALRSFDVIQGQAAPRAITLRAIVQSYGHDMVLDESTASRCKMRGRRKGSREWVSVLWTIDRAKDLGLTSKPNWKNQPQTMLVARATSELARLVAADAILGLGYSAEEIADGGTQTEPETGEGPKPAGTRRLARRTAKTETEAEPGKPSQEQRNLMFALFDEIGPREREGRLEYIGNLLGRVVESSTELDASEVSRVINALQADKEADLADPPVNGDPFEGEQ